MLFACRPAGSRSSTCSGRATKPTATRAASLLVLEASEQRRALGGARSRARCACISCRSGTCRELRLRCSDPAKTRRAHLARQLAEELPPARRSPSIRRCERTPRLWVRYPRASRTGSSRRSTCRRPAPFLIEGDRCCSRRADPVALRDVAVAAAARRASRRPRGASARASGRCPSTSNGPRELRDLIGAFNQMMRRLNDADDDQAVMLAGIAHDLKAPLTRLKLRASVLVEDEAERAHFMRDIDSLTRIVQQFLEFAARSPSRGPEVDVDDVPRGAVRRARRRRRRRSFALSLEAGDAFTPAAHVPRPADDESRRQRARTRRAAGRDRTGAASGDWLIEVRDHGPGIPDERIDDAMRPFVRLDPARSGDGHCGLGLAIVERLAREQRRTLRNRQRGGRRADRAHRHSLDQTHDARASDQHMCLLMPSVRAVLSCVAARVSRCFRSPFGASASLLSACGGASDNSSVTETPTLSTVENFRDVARQGDGYPTVDGARLRRGVFYRSGALTSDDADDSRSRSDAAVRGARSAHGGRSIACAGSRAGGCDARTARDRADRRRRSAPTSDAAASAWMLDAQRQPRHR